MGWLELAAFLALALMVVKELIFGRWPGGRD